MDDNETEKSALEYPGVEPAQMFILPSYQWMLQRLESADSRIHALVTFVATVTFAFPAVAVTMRETITFYDVRFVSAMGFGLTAIVCGLVARIHGGVKLVNPGKLYDGWLHWSPWEFHKNALYWAGKDFRTNATLVGKKSRMVTIVTGLFIAEMLCLLLWIIGA